MACCGSDRAVKRIRVGLLGKKPQQNKPGKNPLGQEPCGEVKQQEQLPNRPCTLVSTSPEPEKTATQQPTEAGRGQRGHYASQQGLEARD